MTDKVAIPTMADLLDPLDQWVTAQAVPADAIVQTSKAGVPPSIVASRPMCRYPGYPHYIGGDKSLATSYECRPSQP